MKKNLLIFIIVLVTLVEIVELAFIFVWAKERINKAIISQYQEKRAKVVSNTLNDIKNEMDTIIAKLTIASHNEEVIRGVVDGCSRELEGYLPYFHGKIDVLNRINLDAKVICSSREQSLGANLDKTLPHLKKILEDEAHPVVLGRIRKSPINGEPVFGVHVPVFQGQRFVGALGAAIYLDKIEEKYLKQIIDFPMTRIFLTDDNGDYVYKNSENLQRGAREMLLFFEKEVFPGRFWRLTTITTEKDLIGNVDKRADVTRDMNISQRILFLIILTLLTGAAIILLSLKYCLKK